MRLLSFFFCFFLLSLGAQGGEQQASEADVLPLRRYVNTGGDEVESPDESLKLYRSWSAETMQKKALGSVEIPLTKHYQVQWNSYLNERYMKLNSSFQKQVSTLTSSVQYRKKELKSQSFKDFRRFTFQRNSGSSTNTP